MSLHDAFHPLSNRRCRFGALRCAIGIHVRERRFRPWGWNIGCWRCGKRFGSRVVASPTPFTPRRGVLVRIGRIAVPLPQGYTTAPRLVKRLWALMLVVVVALAINVIPAPAAAKDSFFVVVNAQKGFGKTGYAETFQVLVWNTTAQKFSTVGVLTAQADGNTEEPVVLKSSTLFFGSKFVMQWRMTMPPRQVRVLTFTVKVLAKRSYCLKVRTDNTVFGTHHGGSNYGQACVNITP